MREIGVRELKATLSRVLREVEEGEQIRVTVRGRAVADLVPVGAPGRYDQEMRKLIAEGRIKPASQPLPRSAPPPIKTGKSAIAIVLAEREEER